MPSSGNLEEIYIEEMRDLWSANDQMRQVMQSLSEKASDRKLKDLLEKSVTGIGKHTETLKSCSKGPGARPEKSVARAWKGWLRKPGTHALDEKLEPSMRDLVIIAQYQRMSHYGLAGFGTAAAYAEALGEKDGAAKLNAIVKDIYKADEFSSQLAERAEKAAAKAA